MVRMKVDAYNNDLVSGLQRGSESAIRQLYALHYRALCYFAERILDDKDEAEDIAVESFLKLLEKKEQFTSLPHIKSFLFTVARNACIDHLRRNKTVDKAARELEHLAEPVLQTVEQEMLVAKVLQVIYSEVEQLPGQCQRVFKSVFFEGKDTATVAAEMGISTQTVLNQKSKALQLLRVALYREGLYSSALFFYCLLLLSAQCRS